MFNFIKSLMRPSKLNLKAHILSERLYLVSYSIQGIEYEKPVMGFNKMQAGARLKQSMPAASMITVREL